VWVANNILIKIVSSLFLQQRRETNPKEESANGYRGK
jgi:hypothetical protein